MTATDLRDLVAAAPVEDLPALAGRLAEAQALIELRLRQSQAPAPAPEQGSDVLDTKGAAEYLDMAPAQLRELVRRRLVPHFRLPGIGRDGARVEGRPRFQRSDLDRWIREQVEGA